MLPNPAAGNQLVNNLDKLGDTSPLVVTGPGMTERQSDLNLLWAKYRTVHYDGRAVDYDGRQVVRGPDREMIASQAYLPAGFVNAAPDYPAKLRRPSAPYNLYKVIVDRFTGLLFGATHRPRIRVQGDPDSEQYVRAIEKQVRLWARMVQVRTYGGATGTAVMVAKLVDGQPRLEVLDPRWCHAVFADREELTVARLEYRYTYNVPVRDPETGRTMLKAAVYRRVINDVADVLFEPVVLPDDPEQLGNEPRWVPKAWAVHNLGFCPVVWIQNLPLDGEIDGDCDFQGIDDLVEDYDTTMSQAGRAIRANSDPTVVFTTNANLPEIKLGSQNALKVPIGSSVEYLESALAGAKAAIDYSNDRRERALEVAQCVVDGDSGGAKTATEVSRAYSSMLEKADVLREQYGQQGIRKWMQMMLRIILHVTRDDLIDPITGQKVLPQAVRLPPKIVERVDDVGNKIVDRVPQLPPKHLQASVDLLDVEWPPYYAPSTADMASAVDAAGKALEAGVIDVEHARAFLAPYLKIDDVEQMAERIADDLAAQAERELQAQIQAAQLAQQAAAPAVAGAPAANAPPGVPPPGSQTPAQAKVPGSPAGTPPPPPQGIKPGNQ